MSTHKQDHNNYFTMARNIKTQAIALMIFLPILTFFCFEITAFLPLGIRVQYGNTIQTCSMLPYAILCLGILLYSIKALTSLIKGRSRFLKQGDRQRQVGKFTKQDILTALEDSGYTLFDCLQGTFAYHMETQSLFYLYEHGNPASFLDQNIHEIIQHTSKKTVDERCFSAILCLQIKENLEEKEIHRCIHAKSQSVVYTAYDPKTGFLYYLPNMKQYEVHTKQFPFQKILMDVERIFHIS